MAKKFDNGREVFEKMRNGLVMKNCEIEIEKNKKKTYLKIILMKIKNKKTVAFNKWKMIAKMRIKEKPRIDSLLAILNDIRKKRMQ